MRQYAFHPHCRATGRRGRGWHRPTRGRAEPSRLGRLRRVPDLRTERAPAAAMARGAGARGGGARPGIGEIRGGSIGDLDALTETEVEQDGRRFMLRSAPRPAASLTLRATGVALPPSVQSIA